jgi:hypothetical protein
MLKGVYESLKSSWINIRVIHSLYMTKRSLKYLFSPQTVHYEGIMLAYLNNMKISMAGTELRVNYVLVSYHDDEGVGSVYL